MKSVPETDLAADDHRTRDDLARELASLLLAGQNCRLEGPDLMGKSPLVKEIGKLIREQAGCGVSCVPVDLNRRGGETWGDVGECFVKALREVGVTPPEETGPDWRLSDGLRSVLTECPETTRLILLFDHTDELPRETALRLAMECNHVVKFARAEAAMARVSMLWSGEKERMADAITACQGFPLIAVTRRIGVYGREDVASLLNQYATAFHLPNDSAFLEEILRLTGGFPGLVRHYPGSYMAELSAALARGTLQSAVDTGRTAAQSYVRSMLAALQSRKIDRASETSRMAHRIVERVESKGDLLSLLTCMRLSDSMTAVATRFPGVVRDHGHIFLESGGQLQCRGDIIAMFLREYFTFDRLALGFFVLDKKRESWSQALLCCALHEQEPEAHSARSESRRRPASLLAQNSFRFLEALSDRLHLQTGSPAMVIEYLILTIRHFLGAPSCVAYEHRDQKLWPVDCQANQTRFSNEVRELGMPIDIAPGPIRLALKTRQPIHGSGNNNLAIPLKAGRRVAYVVWIEDAPVDDEVREIIRTAVRFSEGPVAAAEEQARQGKLLQQLVNSNPEDRIQVVDRDRHILLLSRRSREDIGQEANPIGKTCRELFAHDCCRDCVCDKVFSDREHHRTLQRWDVPCLGTDRRKKWFDVHAWPIVDESGEVSMVCQVARDVSSSVASLQLTGKLLEAASADDVYQSLLAAMKEMGFERGRLYECEDPEADMDCPLISRYCFGHDRSFERQFRAGEIRMDGRKEDYWYKAFKKRQTGVILLRSETYRVDAAKAADGVATIHVSRDLEQVAQMAGTRPVRAQTALLAEGLCFGTVVADMGERADRVPEFLSHRFFGLVRFAALSLVRLESRRLETLLRGFRHSLAIPIQEFDLMIDICARSQDERRREAARHLAKDAMADLFYLSENLATQFNPSGKPRQKAEFRHVDVVPMVKELERHFHDWYGRYGFQFAYDGPDSATAWIEPHALRMILSNLLVNAVKAIQANASTTKAVTLRTVVNAEGRVRQIEVEDTGGGVPEGLDEEIYKPGYSRFGSTGIGLPACRYFAKLMHATVRHKKSVRTGGAVFTLFFEEAERE